MKTLASTVLASVSLAGAHANAPTPAHVQRYDTLYNRVVRLYGREEPGRQIVRDGTNHGRATDRDVVQSIGVLRRMLAPRAQVSKLPTVTTTVAASTQTSYSSGGGYSIPSSIVQCESGGNWSAVNPSSGAGGAYQILPSTWAAYGGTGAPQDASHAEQSAIAARIMASQGPSAWTC